MAIGPIRWADVTQPQGSDAPDTVTEALAELAREGYDADFTLRDEGIHCPVCNTVHSFEAAVVDRIYRFEGPSDPGDEAVVFGLRCGNCGARGALASAFGLDADPDLLQGLVYLSTQAQHR
jgi:hypothetical protein